ncbi:3-methyladenine DNA glycosylase AlkD [Paenibacillus sp. yr247]|uniref:DNA alkylation repair protein n=1 Tax=Paenibacillus sp. yr247 TaxID=1761880 RepID=UPI00087FA4B3|nr:DNA alkylation repair protein [Paenibacillus sp. yr247]SDO98959.1 3-methyladenine DNA glycosylase AlkD [Paenibacillus sp. yr247]
MASPYTDKLEAWLRAHSNAADSTAMAAYMQNQFPFLGIRNPERVALTKQFWKENGFPKGAEGVRVAEELWQLPEREFAYTAMLLLIQLRKEAERERIEVLERMVATQSWWDSVDTIADHLIGFQLQKYPDLIPAYVEKWLASGNMWLQRTAILFQLKYKQRTDVPLLFSSIRRMADSNEFFIRKAIGWALREYSKTDAAAVQAFVAETELSPLSVREALKVIQRKEAREREK